MRLWAPILVHTMEEAWDALVGAPEGSSVHLADWPERGPTDTGLGDWVAALRRIRTEIEKKADPLRKDKVVGGGQDLRVRYAAGGPEVQALDADAQRYGGADAADAVLEILGVAEFECADVAELDETDVADLRLAVARSDLERCERCRRRRSEAVTDGGATLCGRCEPWRGAA